MNVVSLFDGISCARVALDYAGIPVDNYYSCEIDKAAVQVSNNNYPDIVRLGSVVDFKKDMVKQPVDLLIGGSPCQDLSIAKKDRQGLAGNRSSLFYEYVRIRDEVKPKWFILENVASMKAEDRDTISKIMGCQPVMFNASLVSAQTRKRYFWTNIKFDLPDDKGISLLDILQPADAVDPRMNIKQQMTPTPQTGRNAISKLGYVGGINCQGYRVYSSDGKSCCLSANGGGPGYNTGLYKIGNLGGSNSQACRVYSSDGKSCCLSANGGGLGAKTGLYKIGGDLNIRRLTPIECERLQSLPDDYTEGICNSQRYKCLGNAFNCRVIAHILTAMLQQPKRVKIKLRLKSNHAPI